MIWAFEFDKLIKFDVCVFYKLPLCEQIRLESLSKPSPLLSLNLKGFLVYLKVMGYLRWRMLITDRSKLFSGELGDLN